MQNEEKKRKMKQEQERYEMLNNKDMASYMGVGADGPSGPGNGPQQPAMEAMTGGFPNAPSHPGLGGPPVPSQS